MGGIYYGQILAALINALVIAYVTLSAGYSLGTAVVICILVYISSRWMIAWLFRIRHWHHTDGSDSQSCPSCDQYIYRKSGDWILTCHRCGWRPGIPVVRWVVYSLPIQQLRRTIVGVQLIVVLLLVTVLLTGTPAQITAENISNFSLADETDTPDPFLPSDKTNTQSSVKTQSMTQGTETGLTNTPSSKITITKTPTPAVSGSYGYNLTKVEHEFMLILESERAARDLSLLSLRAELSEMGRTHAENMAEHNYVGHEWPSGVTIQDRYEKRELLPECRLDVIDSDMYYQGAENAASAHVDQPFTADGELYTVDNETELARALFSMWMNSPLHRVVMLLESVDEMGLGIYIKPNGKAYAALELC